MSSIVNINDDVEPYKSATPWCYAPLVQEYPIVNYPNKNLRIKMLLFVGPGYYHEIRPWRAGWLEKSHYSPRVDAKHPRIEVNSIIEICGTVDNIKNKRYGQLQHRAVCSNIYHHYNPPEGITNPQRQLPQPVPRETGDTTNNEQHQGKQWTSDDVMLLLNKYWNAARQHYISQNMTHNAKHPSFLAYFDLIPYTLPKREYFIVGDQNYCFFGVLGIVSKIDATHIHLLIPTQSASMDEQLTVLPYPAIGRARSLCLYPTIGSLCLLYENSYMYHCAHLPLISPPWLDNDASTHPAGFTAEMFEKSFYMTDPVTRATLLKLMAHHTKLSQNIVSKKYNENNPPPHDECIDINAYLDIVSQSKAMEKKLQQEKEEKERKQKEEEEEEQQKQQEKLQQERLQRLQKDTAFILDVLKYHNHVIISPRAQKIIQQHPFLQNYITTQISTPFQQYQQEMYDYLDDHYSIITDHTLPSPLVSNMYYVYQQFIKDIQHKLVALSSDDLSCSLIQCNVSNNDNINNNNINTNNINNNSNSDQTAHPATTTTPQIPIITTSSLLQLQPPHIYHHAHPADWQRARFPQRRHQHILASTTTTTQTTPTTTTTQATTPMTMQPSSSQFLSTTNTPLHHLLNKSDITLHPTVDLSQRYNTSECDASENEQQFYHDNDRHLHDHHLLTTKYETLRDLFISTKQHNDELLQQLQHQPTPTQHQHQEERENNPLTTTTLPIADDTVNNKTAMLLQNQVDHLKTQLAVKDKQLEAKDEQLQAKDHHYQQQLTTKDTYYQHQLDKKDNYIADITQHYKEQLAAKDKQVQQLLEMMMASMSTTTTLGRSHPTHGSQPE